MYMFVYAYVSVCQDICGESSLLIYMLPDLTVREEEGMSWRIRVKIFILAVIDITWERLWEKKDMLPHRKH